MPSKIRRASPQRVRVFAHEPRHTPAFSRPLPPRSSCGPVEMVAQRQQRARRGEQTFSTASLSHSWGRPAEGTPPPATADRHHSACRASRRLREAERPHSVASWLDVEAHLGCLAASWALSRPVRKRVEIATWETARYLLPPAYVRSCSSQQAVRAAATVALPPFIWARLTRSL